MADSSAAEKRPAKKKNKKKIGKVPGLIYYPVFVVVSLIFRLRYGVRVHRGALKGLRGPMIVLAPHLCNKDHVFTAMALWPRRATYVLSEHFRTTPLMRFVCGLVHAVTKKMFCPDTGAVLGIIRAVREGNPVVLFPEGRLTWYGRSLEVTEGTAELCKQLKVPVVCVTSDGAGRTFPKWAKFKRHGRIDVRTEILMTPEQIESMSLEEVDATIRRAVKHDEEKVQPGVKFRTKDTAAGLDGILWKCPSCGAEYTLKTEANHVRCEHCDFDVILDEYGNFSEDENLAKNGIKTIADFYEFCARSVDISEPVSMPVTVSGTNAEGYMTHGIGEGVFTVGKEGFCFVGKLDDADVNFSIPLEKVAGFPITVGDHVDIYYNKRLLLMEPSPDRRKAIILVTYLEKLRKAEGLSKDI